LKLASSLLDAVFYNEVLVGVVGCKVTLIDEEAGPTSSKQVYIATMAVLPAYRDLGIGSSAGPQLAFAMLNHLPLAGTKAITHVLSNIKDHAEIIRVFLHVQEGNDDAVRFYERAGFTVEGVVEGYFPALTPSNAKLMSLAVKH